MSGAKSVGRIQLWLLFGPALALIVPASIHFRKFLFPPPPSYAMAVLGVLAIVMVFALPKEPSKWHKFAWITTAFVLMLVEMWAVKNDRNVQEQKYEEALFKAEEQFQVELRHLGSIETNVQGVPSIVTGVSKDARRLDTEIAESHKRDERDALKDQALEVVKEIDDFVFAHPVPGANDGQNIEDFRERAQNEWSRQLEARVNSITAQLKAQGAMHATLPFCDIQQVGVNAKKWSTPFMRDAD